MPCCATVGFVVPVKKRFIAGAICPACKAQDTVKMYRIDDTDYRECVACDFSDKIRLHSAPRELQTRVNTTAQQRAEQTSVIKIVEPSAKNKSQ